MAIVYSDSMGKIIRLGPNTTIGSNCSYANSWVELCVEFPGSGEPKRQPVTPVSQVHRDTATD